MIEEDIMGTDISERLQEVKRIFNKTMLLSVQDAYLWDLDILGRDATDKEKERLTTLKEKIAKECRSCSWQEHTPSQYSKEIFDTDLFEFSTADLYRICYKDALDQIVDNLGEFEVLDKKLVVKIYKILKPISKLLSDNKDEETNPVKINEQLDVLIDETKVLSAPEP
jgi:hypothetical protein